MDELRQRLNRFKQELSRRPIPIRSVPVVDWTDLDCREQTNEWGSFMLRKRIYPEHYRHGHYGVAQLIEHVETLSAFHGGGGVSHEQLLFFDTETTGLGVGAGNIPFMAGLGYYRGSQLVVEQLLIRNPAEEAAMLAYLQQLIGKFTHIITFNGKTFDWSLLRNRLIMNRMSPPKELLHLDLLYPSRSLWKHTLSSCRLSMVELERLGVIRKDDVPGSIVPSLYFQFLQENDPRLLEGVLHHNELDIVSLVTLATHFSFVLSGSISLHELSVEEVYRIGLWLNKMGRQPQAQQAFQHVLNRPAKEKCDYINQIAAIYKRQGNYEAAVQLWLQFIDGGNHSRFGTLVYIELAMYYEHNRRDAVRALHYAELAEEVARKRLTLSRGDAKQQIIYDQLQKRMKRLRRKARRIS